MARSAIYVVNTSTQDIVDGGTVNFGSTQRRFGCNLMQAGNAIQMNGSGYYKIISSLTLEPTAASTITATFYKDGVAIPGASASATVAAVDTTINLNIVAITRENCCCCDDISNITCVISGGAVTGLNIATAVEKL